MFITTIKTIRPNIFIQHNEDGNYVVVLSDSSVEAPSLVAALELLGIAGIEILQIQGKALGMFGGYVDWRWWARSGEIDLRGSVFSPEDIKGWLKMLGL